MITTKEIDDIRKRIEATESYLNISSWRDVTTTLAADDQTIADAANRITTALDRYKGIIEDISKKVVIPGEILETIESEDYLNIPFGLSVNEVVDCACREDVATLLKGDTDWEKINPERKKMIGVISKIASVDLSRTENPWPIVMNCNDKYYTDANIKRCIALYWQRIPLFRLCAILLKCDTDKISALAIAYYAKTVCLFHQTADFKHTISPFLSQIDSSANNDLKALDSRVSEVVVPVGVSISTAQNDLVEIEIVDKSPNIEVMPTEHSLNEVISKPDDKGNLALILTERIERLYCPFKNGGNAGILAKKLIGELNSKDIEKAVNFYIDFRKCEKGVKKDIFKILVALRLYHLSYSNFCKHTN